MPEFERMPIELHKILSGKGFHSRKCLALPFLTVDPEGFPRAALLTLSEVRAISREGLSVAVQAGSRTAANLIRRQKAAVCYLARNWAAWIQTTAGQGRTCDADPERQIFPLAVFRVKIDQARTSEAGIELLSGPTFAAAGVRELFSEELFEELAGR
jgi:flavin reductase (DIM6/NTAB) family NADH-FMN oxidoreductase RutF